MRYDTSHRQEIDMAIYTISTRDGEKSFVAVQAPSGRWTLRNRVTGERTSVSAATFADLDQDTRTFYGPAEYNLRITDEDAAS